MHIFFTRNHGFHKLFLARKANKAHDVCEEWEYIHISLDMFCEFFEFLWMPSWTCLLTSSTISTNYKLYLTCLLTINYKDEWLLKEPLPCPLMGGNGAPNCSRQKSNHAHTFRDRPDGASMAAAPRPKGDEGPLVRTAPCRRNGSRVWLATRALDQV